MIMSCTNKHENKELSIYETAAGEPPMQAIEPTSGGSDPSNIHINPEHKNQIITGFGGAITQSTAWLLQNMGEKNRDTILEAYFGEQGAQYSMVRTHINSCDFSTHQYAYAMVPNDLLLENFDVSRDREDIIPIIKKAKEVSKEGFKILSSPWTAPPWMKDNKDWVGGKLLPQYYDVWALYFSKYIQAYQKEGIDIWGITVENEPLGNGNNWESMHFTPGEMNDFVLKHLGPQMEKDGYDHVKILGYDQNRADLQEWVDAMYEDEQSSKYYDGTAIHWYESTYEVFPEALKYAKQKAPDKYLLQTEACIDAEVPHWQDDDWYWKAEATDWGWDWAPEDKKYLHPKYEPVYRYARDIIGCLNNGVDGWIDWNMVLDRQGGPNWFKNWCVAPVIVDPEKDEVYFTPLYYTMIHFSRFIRPGATIIESSTEDKEVMLVAAENPDKTIALVLFNPQETPKDFVIHQNGQMFHTHIRARALQTLLFTN